MRDERLGIHSPHLGRDVASLVAVLVLLVMILLALFSLWSSPGLRCSASWPVWTRRTVFRELVALADSSLCMAGTAGSIRRSLWLLSGPRCFASRPVRTKRPVTCCLFRRWFCRRFPLIVGRPKMLGMLVSTTAVACSWLVFLV